MINYNPFSKIPACIYIYISLSIYIYIHIILDRNVNMYVYLIQFIKLKNHDSSPQKGNQSGQRGTMTTPIPTQSRSSAPVIHDLVYMSIVAEPQRRIISLKQLSMWLSENGDRDISHLTHLNTSWLIIEWYLNDFQWDTWHLMIKHWILRHLFPQTRICAGFIWKGHPASCRAHSVASWQPTQLCPKLKAWPFHPGLHCVGEREREIYIYIIIYRVDLQMHM